VDRGFRLFRASYNGDMGLFDFLPLGSKPTEQKDVIPVLPQEIFARGVLELQDVIAPSALQITSRELNFGKMVGRTFFVISYPRFFELGLVLLLLSTLIRL
jgi:hypothetical protein